MRRIGEGRAPPGFGEQMAEMCLQALCADPRRIAAVLGQDLSELPARSARHGIARTPRRVGS